MSKKHKKYYEQINGICRLEPALSQAYNNPEFLYDLIALRTAYRKLYKAKRYMYLYPTAPPKRFNEMGEDIQVQQRLMRDIAKQWDIKVEFFRKDSVEMLKFERPCEVKRKGVIICTLLGF